MEFVSEISINDLYLKNIDIINEIYDDYSHLELDRNSFDSLVLKSLKQLKKQFKDYLIDDFSICFESILRECFENTDLEYIKKNINSLKYDKENIDIYFQTVNKYNVLSESETLALLEKIKQGDKKAREFLINSNLKLVCKIASFYSKCGISYIDLIQEGSIGLINAVDGFDINKSKNFSMYASECIKFTIIKAIQYKSRNIKIPYYLNTELFKYKKAICELGARTDKPTIEQICEVLNISKEDAIKFESLVHDTLSINYILYKEHENDDALSEGKYDEENSCLKENKNFLNLSYEEDFLNIEMISEYIKKDINVLFKKAKLKPRHIDILNLYFGLNGQQKLSLIDIGDKYNLTRQRIRQIISASLKKIRTTSYVYNLAPYTDDEKYASDKIDEYKKNYSKSGSNKKCIF